MRQFVFALVIAAALAGCTSVALADDGPMYVVGNGGNVAPMGNADIRMAAETVQAVCYSRYAEYRIDFRFKNDGASRSVLLGFPFAAPYYKGPLENGDRYVAPAGFSAWQDGKPLAVELKYGGKDDYPRYDYYTHEAVFPPGDTTITVDYLVAPWVASWGPADQPFAEGDIDIRSKPTTVTKEYIEAAHYDYILHTGSYWKGPIGDAVLQWTLSPDFVGWGIGPTMRWASEIDTSDASYEPDPEELLASHILASYTTPTPGVYRWTFHNFDPTVPEDEDRSPYDLSLHFVTPPQQPQKDMANAFVDPKAKASSSYSSGAYSYPAANVVDGDPSTAWAENASGPGIGQHVDLTFPRKRQVRELRILPGYAKRPELFGKYNRPKRLRFDFSDGTSKTIQLADSPTLQHFAVNASAKSAKVTILDVYHGTTADETYISEIEFGQAPAPAFEDPGTLLAQSRSQPSADRMPSSAPAEQAQHSPSASASLAAARGSEPSARPSPIEWTLLGFCLVSAAAIMWKTSAELFRSDAAR